MAQEETSFHQLALRAGQVFTPTSPIDDRSLFAGRLDQVRLVIDVVNQKGQHAILYGERGVGKTSLANVVSSFLGIGNVLAPRVNCDSTDDFETVWRKVFEKIGDTIVMSRPANTIGFTTTGATGTATTSATVAEPLDLLPNGVTPDAVRRALATIAQVALPIIIIDEFDRLEEESRRAFADTVKMFSDHGLPATLILVGVADSVEQLIREHESVERALNQIPMPRMSSQEIDQILQNGVTALGMTIEPAAAGRISRLTQGLPHYAHLLGLHAARAALDGEHMVVSNASVASAVETAISGSQQSIQTDYEIAVRSAKKDSLFADVLLACALADTTELGYFAAQDVREPLRRITQRYYAIPSYAQHLNEFCEEKRGAVLQKSGTRRLYRYRFTNPLLQPHVIMRGLRSGRISHDMLD